MSEQNETTEATEATETVDESTRYSRGMDFEAGTFSILEGTGDERETLESFDLAGIPEAVIRQLALKAAAGEALYIFKREGESLDSIEDLLEQWRGGVFKATSEPLTDRQRWEAMAIAMQEAGDENATAERSKEWWFNNENADKRKNGGTGRKGCTVEQLQVLDFPPFVGALAAIQTRDREAAALRKTRKLASKGVVNPFA